MEIIFKKSKKSALKDALLSDNLFENNQKTKTIPKSANICKIIKLSKSLVDREANNFIIYIIFNNIFVTYIFILATEEVWKFQEDRESFKIQPWKKDKCLKQTTPNARRPPTGAPLAVEQ